MINVVQKKIQRRDALRQAAFQMFPFLGRNNARQQIKRKNFLCPRRVAINIKRDALPEKRIINRLALGLKFRLGQFAEQLVKFLIMRAHRVLRIRHLVETVVDLVLLQHIPSVVFLTS